MSQQSERKNVIVEILQKHEKDILANWLEELKKEGATTGTRISDSELQTQCREFMRLVLQCSRSGQFQRLDTADWQPVLEFLESVSASRAVQGFSAEQTALFVQSSKKPIFSRLRTEMAGDSKTLGDEAWVITEVIDKLSLHTIKAFQKTREAIIIRQQEELLELSTPVVKLWDGVLALPMIGTLDSARTQVVMESLLQRIVDTESEIAIIDITGVPTVDTLVAQHLIKTVTAIRLMGADCIISGIRPQIAQTIVHLGVDLQGITTKSTLAEALTLAFKRLGLTVIGTKN